MRFKAYGWCSIDRPKPGMGFGYYTLQLIPGLSIEYTTTDMAQQDIDDWWPHKRDYHGKSVFILLRWLFWGITLDFRFGDDARPERD